MYRTSTGTSGLTTAQTITLTSPNVKTIFIKQYVVATYGVPSPDGMTIQIADEDGNVLWEDAIAKSAGTLGAENRVSHTFPGRGLPVPAKKNATIAIGDPGANSGSEASVLWSF